MGYALFLISLLISTFYYFRMARKFESFDTQVADELQREMNGLILDFNQTASQNIGILEDRMAQGKIFTQEISEQLAYLKKLRDGLGEEVRELQKKKLSLQTEVSSLGTQKQEKSFAIEAYKRTQESLSPSQPQSVSRPSSKRKKQDEPTIFPSLNEDIFDVAEETVLFSQALLKENAKSLPLVQKPAKPGVSMRQKKTKTISSSHIVPKAKTLGSNKEKILAYSYAGKSIEEISKALSVPKGEVELVIKLFQSAG